LILVALVATGANLLAPHDYATQYRDHINERPSSTFPLGTDELGRDRLSRLMYGSRVTLLFAPAAAIAATIIAGTAGALAGYAGGWADRVLTVITDLFLSLPWLFALLTLRALLPLNVSAWTSVAATFALLASVGWASGARVFRANAFAMREQPAILQARATGCRPWRLIFRHILPNLRPVATAQFWILAAGFILAEANLGLLGLGITEPLPSWGNMMSELQNYQRIAEQPWILAPVALVVLVVASLHFVASGDMMWG
jgi:ABC-type dipeptide/oligopeptide/nickel transport system permease subunit